MGASARADIIYSAGHGDIGLAFDAGNLFLHYHLGQGAIANGVAIANPAGEEYTPAEVITFVPNPSVARPAGAQWNFLGNNAGDPFWFLPATSDPAKPFLGFAAEELANTANVTWSNVQFRLTAMTGPGHFSLYTVDGALNPTISMSTFDGISNADRIDIAAGSHNHYFFGFSQQGIYELSITASATRTEGANIQNLTDSGVFRFGVTAVPEPSSLALAAVGIAALGGRFARRLRRPSRKPNELT